jgi:hypothetical protein
MLTSISSSTTNFPWATDSQLFGCRVESYVTTDGQSASLSWNLRLTTRFLLLSDSCGFVDVGRSLWREDGSVVYKSCWSSPAQSVSGPATIFSVSDSRLPFLLNPTTRRATVEVCDPASTRDCRLFGSSQSQSYVTSDCSVGQSVLESSTYLGLTTRSLLLSDSCRLVDVGRSLWREDGSLLCQTHSAVIRLLSICTIYMLQVIKCMYI